jgi:phosphoribosylformylglycinamidine synthase
VTRYRVEVRVTPREGLLDPQGRAVHAALGNLGYDGVDGVRIGRLVRLALEAGSESEATDRVREMCERLIVNPVTEDYEILILGEDGGRSGG